MKYKLEQLERMSDKQINEAILSLITGYPIDKAREIITTGYISKSSFCDYCNSWADMGPLIFDEGISLIKLQDGYQAVCKNWDYIDVANGYNHVNDCCIGTYGDAMADYGHKNPLRAAAIAYILAKQEEY